MPTPAPYFSDVAERQDGESRWLTARDGLRLRAVFWPDPGATGTVFVLPGRTEYAEKYSLLAAELQELGLASLAIDWRGQGLADRVHCDDGAGHVDDFTDYQMDLDAVIAEAKRMDLPRPWVMLGHSMGGCIGLRTLMGGHPFDGVVFSAPMWGINISPALRPLATGVAALSRRFQFSHFYAPGQVGESQFFRTNFDKNGLTTDRTMWEWMRTQVATHPELALGGPSLHWLDEALNETRALHAMPSPELPALVLLGGNEAIVAPDRIHERVARWPGAELVQVPGMKHEMLMEGAQIRGPLTRRIADFTKACDKISA